MRFVRSKQKPILLAITVLFFAGVVATVTKLAELNGRDKSNTPNSVENVQRAKKAEEKLKQTEVKFMWPVKIADVTSTFGLRKEGVGSGKIEKFHKGVDIRRPEGTPVLAAAAGKVILSGEGGEGYGITIIIDHGEGVKSLYAHNQENIVKEGDRVRRWDKIAKVGATGRATGSHLHFEIMVDDIRVNPEEYLPRRLQ